jgi:hypothetical protein
MNLREVLRILTRGECEYQPDAITGWLAACDNEIPREAGQKRKSESEPAILTPRPRQKPMPGDVKKRL